MPQSDTAPSGVFLFDKPKGITSHDAVALLRRKLSFRKIGHTGTLDPMATGLLILLAGTATSAQARMQGTSKVYSGTILFGAETDTWDAEGKIVAEAPPPDLGEENLKKAVAAFDGKISQQVPPYSAVRLNGKHLYKMARRNEVIPEIRREVQVRWLSWAARPPALDFEIECTGGTYIRSIACELGRAMGSRAHLTALRRLSIGTWSVKDAVGAEEFGAMTPEAARAKLLPAPEN
ncbi:MAG: tRNA pseudouridine(55) synthase TruB [Elusimicrobia bacterium GWF2_62_30]|nr:MAG: tRNA pseudouridine(55) synthase TruB [Elusimicrobia bacterium GWF2_62_30]